DHPLELGRPVHRERIAGVLLTEVPARVLEALTVQVAQRHQAAGVLELAEQRIGVHVRARTDSDDCVVLHDTSPKHKVMLYSSVPIIGSFRTAIVRKTGRFFQPTFWT